MGWTLAWFKRFAAFHNARLLAPAAGLALYLADKAFHIHVPNYTSSASPDLNVSLAMLACHVVAVLVIASCERNNRLLSQLLDAELAKHMELATFQVGVSVGHAYTSAGDHEASDLIRHADTAMYQDKERKNLRQGFGALATP